MAIKLMTQPRGSVLCGHYSLAMITGHDVDSIVSDKNMQGKNGLTFEKFVEYLDKHEFDAHATFWPDNRKKLDLSGKGMMTITLQKPPYNWGHAVAFEDGKIYDPVGRVFDSIAEMKEVYSMVKGKKVRVFSHIKLEEEAK